MSVSLTVSSIPAFDPHGEAGTVNQRWEKWLKRFSRYAVASGVKRDEQKRDLLLHTAGPEVQDIFDVLPDTGDSYKEAEAALSKYFKPQQNIPFSRHNFRQAKQQQTETVSQFITRLRELAAPCDYGENLEDFIRDQVIDKCLSNNLRKKLLAEKDLKLARVIELSQAKEASEYQAAEISQEAGSVNAMNIQHSQNKGIHKPRRHPPPPPPRRDTPPAKNSTHNRKQNVTVARQPAQYTRPQPGARRSQSTLCTRCGILGHTADTCRCSKNVQCFKCGKLGHFAKMCKSKSQSKVNDVHCITQQNESFNQRLSDSDSEYAYNINSSLGEITVYFNNIPTKMLIDSGSSCNIINSQMIQRLKANHYELSKCDKIIHPYNSAPIKVSNSITAKVHLEDKKEIFIADFLCVEGQAPCILGRNTALALGVLNLINHTTQTSILEKYPGITDGVGCLRNTQVALHIDKTVTPVARKHSRVPFHRRKKVENELNRLLAENIIEKVSGPTEWVSRIVTPPKPNNPDELRLCVDMRDANRAIQRTRHVTPTMEELVNDLNGAKLFSKIDLRSGYHQLMLKPESRYITTFSTHVGLFQYKRLNFGVNSAAEVFQHTIQTLIQDIEGARNVSDDIIVFGKSQKQHDDALHKTLTVIHNSGLTVNQKKCQFNLPKIEFFGYNFSADGVSPDPKKVQALHEAKEPKNCSEVRSFLGLAQYSARFIKGFATLTQPLRDLTRKHSTWKWEEAEANSFQCVKDSLSSTAVTAYFDPTKFTEVFVDASPVGLAGILSQDGRPIVYASRSLTEVESRYSQTEREALAVVWATEHFHIYLSGSKFNIITDHLPLVNIWKKPDPPLRIARWGLRLQPYSFTIKYQPGKNNPADYMSRHPVPFNKKFSHEEKTAEEYVNITALTSTPLAISLKEVETETSKDATLQTVIKLINTNRWHDIQTFKNENNINFSDLVSFNNCHDELTINSDETVILRNERLVMPESLRKKSIELAHEAHQGVCKTKALIRSKVWFPGIDKEVEKVINSCLPCQVNSRRQTIQPLCMSDLPRGPWQMLSADFCGPIHTGSYLLVITDEYSRYPVVFEVKSTSANAVIPKFQFIFATFSYPVSIKTDNGPPFQSYEWKTFLENCNVKHRKITPYWPRANAQAESFNKPLMKALRAASAQQRDWRQELQNFLRIYRCTPHTTTNYTPFRLLFGRDPRTKFPELTQSSTDIIEATVRIRDQQAKEKMKVNADKKNSAKPILIKPGDRVLVKNKKKDKLTAPYNLTPLTVYNRKGSMITAKREDGYSVTRNVSEFKLMSAPPLSPSAATRSAPPSPVLPSVVTLSKSAAAADPLLPATPADSPLSSRQHPARPKRTVKRPAWITEYSA